MFLVSVVCLEQAWRFSACTHPSVSFSLFNKMDWFQLFPHKFSRAFSAQLFQGNLWSREICVRSNSANQIMFSNLQNAFQSRHYITSQRPGYTTTVGWWRWEVVIMALACPWLREAGWWSALVIVWCLTFVENQLSAILNNEQPTLTFHGRQIILVQITVWRFANYYNIPRTILVLIHWTFSRDFCLRSFLHATDYIL